MSNKVEHAVSITIFILAIITIMSINFYKSQYQKNLCIDTFDKYYDVVKCREDIKDLGAYDTTKYFIKLEKVSNNEKNI